MTQESLNKCLHQAISLKDAAKVQLWLKQGANPKAILNEFGFNPLAHSVSKGDVGFSCTTALLDHAEFSKDELTNALGYAPGAINPFKQIELLLSKGADPDAKNPYGVYVIHDCIGNRKFEEFKLLVKAKANLNVKHLHYDDVMTHLNDKEDAFDVLVWFVENQSVATSDPTFKAINTAKAKTPDDIIQTLDLDVIRPQAIMPLQLADEQDFARSSPSPNEPSNPEAYTFVMGDGSTEVHM